MKKSITRRNFIKRVGAGCLICGTGSMVSGCSKATDYKQKKSSDASMTTRVNNSTGDVVSLLGYGCMRFPLLENAPKNGNYVDQEKVNQLVDYAIEHGVNYFDTAPMYLSGWSEVSTGIALSRHDRSKYYVATKLSFLNDPTFENSVKMYHSSMEKLQVDYIDYYLLHSVGGGSDSFELFNKRFVDNGVLDYLLEERKAGRIRNLGFSFHGDVKLFDYLMTRHDDIHWDFVQIQLNYSDWHNPGKRNVASEYLYGELEKRNIQAVVMEPLLGGRLAKLPAHIAARLQERNPENTVASWAFRFAGSHKNILTVLSGMTFMEHLEENVQTYSPLEELDDDDFKFLEDTVTLMLKYPTIPCNDCKYCMPCSYGIDIPAILLYYNKCINENSIPQNARNEEYLTQRRNFLIGYDRAVPKLRQADHCISCRDCVTKCPQSIDIPKEIQKIDRYIESLKHGNVVLRELADQLHNGKYSLVLSSANIQTTAYAGRGVSDLYKLYTNRPELLDGAALADKVIGKGAAVFMVLGGVKEVYADVICDTAMDLLRTYGVRVVYKEKTDKIMNWSKTDLCPVEKICIEESDNLENYIPKIGEFLKSQGLI